QEFYFDLYKLLIDGDRTEDITIQAGDVILVNPAKQFIELEGEINRPALYEIKEGDTLKDLVKFGAGFTNIANKKNIDYKVLDIESSSIKLLNNQDMNSPLTNIISVKVNPYNSKNTTSIVVSGAVKEPGYYELSENETFQDFIKRLEFIDVYPWLAVLEQFDDKNYERKSILINLNDKDTYDSIKMIPNSKLFFFNIYEIESFKKYTFEELDKIEEDPKNHSLELSELSKKLINDYSLRINHQDNTYIMPVYGRFEINSFVDFLGLDMSNVDSSVSYVSPLSDISYNDDFTNLNLVANKFHTVTFRTSANDLIDITIEGAIDFPGQYTLKSNSNLNDLYKLIGQFKDQAFYDGIILLRESVKERQTKALERSKIELNNLLAMQASSNQSQADINSLNLLALTIDPENLGRVSGNFSPLSRKSDNTILRDGDRIFVPLRINTVSVVGEVQNQTTFEITDKIKTSAAINLAGGFSDFANKRKVYIIKANGLTVKANSFLIGNSNLEPGDTLVVPRKIINENPIFKALQPVTQVISDLAFSAA
ncbi:MAG: SLBB domain-containing protein, partial [Gammaproteobacteria bacterium]